LRALPRKRLLARHAPAVGEQGIDAGEGCPSARVGRVEVERLEVILPGERDVAGTAAVVEELALEEEVVRLRLRLVLRAGGQRRIQRRRDLRRERILHLEQVAELAIVGPRPGLRVARSVDEARGDADAVAGLADASLQHVRHVQLVRDLRNADRLPAEREGRLA
jgi:hypothetical protein